MRSTRLLATSATLAGLGLTLSACSGTTAAPVAGSTTSNAAAPEPSATDSASASAAPSATAAVDAVAATKDILAGKRQALIHIDEEDKDWSATYEGPIAIGSGTDDGARFRLLPAELEDHYLIEALRAREEGGRWCVQADARKEPVGVGTVKCSEGETTLFRITPTGKKDEKGRPTHLITNEKFGALQVKNNGSALYIQELGDGGGRGSYSFVDRGPAE